MRCSTNCSAVKSDEAHGNRGGSLSAHSKAGAWNGLSEGLTVVLGPNESGKSTMTALTRHVLYGYPDGRSKERGYEPLAGSRVARLVFADATGEWAIERLDGKNRGPVSVSRSPRRRASRTPRRTRQRRERAVVSGGLRVRSR